MGGLTFVFVDNFRQTLRVILKGTRADITKACLKSSSLWRPVSTLYLRTNMRIHLGRGNTESPLHLYSVDNGTILNDRGIISGDSK